MNRYSYYSEKAALRKELSIFLQANSNAVLKYYLEYGFNSFVELLKLKFDWQNELLFDFLVFEKKAIVECITQNKAYFLQIIADGKGEKIRDILGVSSEKYEKAWKEALNVLHLYYTEKILENEMFEKATDLYFEKAFDALERKRRAISDSEPTA